VESLFTTSLHLSDFVQTQNEAKILIEGNSLTITLALQNPTIAQDWRIASIISHIRSIIPTTTSWSASHVNRSANFCTQHVASWAATRLHFGCIPISSPLVGPSPTCFEKASFSSFLVP
jgi:hypothetical protein